MESGPGALPLFKCWRAAVNSLCEKVCEFTEKLLGLALWPTKGQTLLERQVKMSCDQQPYISHF